MQFGHIHHEEADTALKFEMNLEDHLSMYT